MNDFTKEELKNLRACLDVCISDDGSDEELMKKLESMIDNYCEHEYHNHCPECNPLNIYCKHCRTYLREKGSVEGFS